MVLLVKKSSVNRFSLRNLRGCSCGGKWVDPTRYCMIGIGMAAAVIGTMIKNIHEEDESTENMRLMCIQEFFKFKSYAAAAVFNK